MPVVTVVTLVPFLLVSPAAGRDLAVHRLLGAERPAPLPPQPPCEAVFTPILQTRKPRLSDVSTGSGRLWWPRSWPAFCPLPHLAGPPPRLVSGRGVPFVEAWHRGLGSHARQRSGREAERWQPSSLSRCSRGAGSAATARQAQRRQHSAGGTRPREAHRDARLTGTPGGGQSPGLRAKGWVDAGEGSRGGAPDTGAEGPACRGRQERWATVTGSEAAGPAPSPEDRACGAVRPRWPFPAPWQ